MYNIIFRSLFLFVQIYVWMDRTFHLYLKSGTYDGINLNISKINEIIAIIFNILYLILDI